VSVLSTASEGATETPRAAVLTCEGLAQEVRRVLAERGPQDVAVVTFPIDCDGSRRSWADIERVLARYPAQTPIFALAGRCYRPLGAPPMALAKRWQSLAHGCHEALLGDGVEARWAANGAALVTPGWLRGAATQTPTLCPTRGIAGCQRLCVLDTGLGELPRRQLERHAEALGVEVQVVPVGLELLGRRLRDALTQDQTRVARERAANHALALDMMGDVAGEHSEAAAIDGVFDFFELVCAPSAMRWLGLDEDGRALAARQRGAATSRSREVELATLAAGPLRFKRSGEGLWLKVGGERALGLLAVEGVAHPERLADYLALALSVERVIALSVREARSRERRLQAERRLADEAERYRVTLESIGDGVIATDAAGRVVLLNEVAAALTGWEAKQARGRPVEDVFEIVNEHTREPCENPVRRVLAEGKRVGLANSTALLARDGSERLIADSGAPIRDGAQRVLGVVLVFRDVTEQLRMEREAARGAKLASVSSLAGGIAHDFNNLLTAIVGNLSLAKLDLDPDHAIYPLLTAAERGAEASQRLTKQLLTFSRGGAPVREHLDPAKLLHEVSGFVLRGSNVSVALRLAEALSPLHADAGQLGQVLTNLLINAKQAMPEGGQVVLEAQNVELAAGELPLPAGRYVRLVVQDEGEGIGPEQLGRIFDPFYTTKAAGSGLGLATVYSIVQRHDGHVSVESTPGRGAAFTLYLPASDGYLDREASPPMLPASPVASQRVLVMDDEAPIREFVSRSLEHLGHEATTTADGEAAMVAYDVARQTGRPYTLLILDMTIPGGRGGLDVIGELRRRGDLVRAVVASGYSEQGVLADAAAHGFDATLAKPFGVDELARCLAGVFGE
jgi:PAS domain S-box-containing protein